MEILRGRQGQLDADELGPGLPDEGDLVVEDVIFVADKDNQVRATSVEPARGAQQHREVVANRRVPHHDQIRIRAIAAGGARNVQDC
jgi:hypothetical protein